VSWYTRAKFGLVRAFLAGGLWCSGLTGLYRFGRFFGTCESLINYKLRRRYRKRLAFIFGPDRFSPAEVRRLTRAWFQRVRCDKIFYLVFDRVPQADMLSRIDFVGRDYVDEGLARGKGVFLSASHAGTHHITTLLLATLGYGISGVRDRKEGAMRLHMQDVFARRCPITHVIRWFFAEEFPRNLFRCLKRNEILGAALDVDRERAPHLRRQSVRIFGQERQWLTGTLQIALRCGATILPFFCASLPGFRFQLIAHEPLVDPASSRDEADLVAEAMQRYADRIEAYIRAHPEHISKV